MKSKLYALREWLGRQWFRLMQGLSLLTIVNFILLSITTSMIVCEHLGMEYQWWFFVIIPPIGIGIGWGGGYVLIEKFKLHQARIRAERDRNPWVQQILNELKEIKEELRK